MRILMLILLVSLSLNGWAQQQKEMDIYDGLMYASTDIQEMKKTTDSLNLRYLDCVANPVYYSWPQTHAMLIKLKVPKKHAEKIVSRLKQNVPLEQLFSNAVKEALEKGNGSTELESLGEGICSKDTILLMKRSRIVVGSCSMDDAPRRHARDIATLAAQTHSRRKPGQKPRSVN